MPDSTVNVTDPQTLGLSPKAISAALAGYLAPLIVGFLADKAGVNVGVSTATALLLPVVSAVVVFAAAALSRVGLVALPAVELPDDEAAPGEVGAA